MVESYYNTGMQHSNAAAGFGTALSDVAKSVQNDKDISEPILKVLYFHIIITNPLWLGQIKPKAISRV